MDKQEKITGDKNVQESFDRFASEISNKTYAKAYLAVKDCIGQKEYCERIGLNESRFSRVVRKVQGLPTNKRPVKKTSTKKVATV